MADALPIVNPECPVCAAAGTTAVPGPKGDAGTNGTNGTDGVDAYTTTSANFTMPAEGANVNVTCADASWMATGQVVFIEVAGHMEVVTEGSTTVTLKNLENTSNSEYTSNAAPSTSIPSGSLATPSGPQGPAGTSGATTGLTSGTGTPEGSETAAAPAIYQEDANGALWFKRDTSSGNTGWERVNDVFNVLDYGAATTETAANNVTAIQAASTAAVAAASTTNHTTLLVPRGEFDTDSTITVGDNVNVVMLGRIKFTGTHDQVCLQIDQSSENDFQSNHLIKVYSSSKSTWGDEAYVGVEIIDADSSTIRIDQADRFTVGVKFTGTTLGCGYNSIHLGRIVDNKIGVLMDGTATDGWFNENELYGGRIAVTSSTNLTSAAYGFKLMGGANTACNDNVFYSPSIEINGQAAGVTADRIPVWIVDGRRNKFLDCRSENNEDSSGNLTFAQIDAGNGGNIENFFSIQTEERHPTTGAARSTIVDNSGRGSNYLEGERIIERFYMPRRRIELHEDWLTGNTAGSHAWATGTSGAGAAVTWSAGDASNPGQITLDTGTTATGEAHITLSAGAGSGGMFVGSNYCMFECAIKIPTLSTASEEYILRVGLNTDDNALGTDAVLWEYDRATSGDVWRVLNRASSSNNYSALTDAVTAATWLSLRTEMESAGTNTKFFLNDEQISSKSSPPSAGMKLNFHIVKSNGTTARTAIIDFFNWRQFFLNDR